MKASHLHDVWAGPDNTRLTNKQFSFRFPTHIAAKLAALGDIYPQKTRTQIVADLLTAALDDLEKSLPEAAGRFAEDAADSFMANEIGCEVGERFYYMGGIRGEFWERSNAHYQELEKEMGNENPSRLFNSECLYVESHFAKK